jgi:hypothetical protein
MILTIHNEAKDGKVALPSFIQQSSRPISPLGLHGKPVGDQLASTAQF